jgi:hypothetical protein
VKAQGHAHLRTGKEKIIYVASSWTENTRPDGGDKAGVEWSPGA